MTPPLHLPFPLKSLKLLLVLSLLAFATLFLPLPKNLQTPPAPNPTLTDRHGKILGDFPRDDFFRHQPASLEEIPQQLIDATLAAEDKRFFHHPGIDYLATLRAFYQNQRHQRITSGASTITQQLVKITREPKPRTPLTKIEETFLARQLEARWDKETILLNYLNQLDYGHHRQGCATAARYYFDRDLADLSLAQAALLAALPQAPTRLNPAQNPAAARERRNWILDRLAREFSYPADLIARAKNEPLQLANFAQKNIAPHLAHNFHKTTQLSLDADLQRATKKIIRAELATLRDKNVQQAALVVIDNKSGEILAFHGSGDFNSGNGGQLNGALLPRSAGSTLKPFTYLLAMQDHGMFPGTVIADIPTQYRTAEGLSAPVNYDHRNYGPVTIRYALANSLNVAAMRTLNQIGGPEPLHHLMQKIGFTSLPDSSADLGLGLTIGNAEVSLLNLTNAYATFARLGEYQAVTFEKNHAPLEKSQFFSPDSAYLIADILSDNQARSATFGHNSSLRLPFRCAVKTGTSSNFRDNWCLGFTADFTVGVWVGNFDNTPMAGVSGVSGAGPIFNATMRELHKNHLANFPERPAKLVEITIDPRNGHRLGDYSPQNVRELKKELCPRDRLPQLITAADYDKKNRALLSPEYAVWFASEDNRQKTQLALQKNTAADLATAPKILSPLPGTIFYLDPELPSQSDTLTLVSNLLGNEVWTSDSLNISGNTAKLSPGTHQITLQNTQTGQQISRQITVESL